MKTLAILSVLVLNFVIYKLFCREWANYDNHFDIVSFFITRFSPTCIFGLILLNIFMVLFFIKSRK